MAGRIRVTYDPTVVLAGGKARLRMLAERATISQGVSLAPEGGDSAILLDSTYLPGKDVFVEDYDVPLGTDANLVQAILGLDLVEVGAELLGY
jgi:hypothetical protein